MGPKGGRRAHWARAGGRKAHGVRHLHAPSAQHGRKCKGFIVLPTLRCRPQNTGYAVCKVYTPGGSQHGPCWATRSSNKAAFPGPRRRPPPPIKHTSLVCLPCSPSCGREGGPLPLVAPLPTQQAGDMWTRAEEAGAGALTAAPASSLASLTSSNSGGAPSGREAPERLSGPDSPDSGRC